MRSVLAPASAMIQRQSRRQEDEEPAQQQNLKGGKKEEKKKEGLLNSHEIWHRDAIEVVYVRARAERGESAGRGGGGAAGEWRGIQKVELKKASMRNGFGGGMWL